MFFWLLCWSGVATDYLYVFICNFICNLYLQERRDGRRGGQPPNSQRPRHAWLMESDEDEDGEEKEEVVKKQKVCHGLTVVEEGTTHCCVDKFHILFFLFQCGASV